MLMTSGGAVEAAISRLTGFALDARRMSLTADRIAPLLDAYGLRNADELALRLRLGIDTALAADVVDAVVVNETLFFRDRAVFDALRTKVLPQLIEHNRERRRLRFWSAACSTGQEPYSIAMLLDEQVRALAGWSVDIMATDLSRRALALARAGIYSHFEVQRGLSTHNLLRYFRKMPKGWEIAEALRASVAFSERNLLADFRALGSFDLICCRNVLMYMEMHRRTDILARIGQVLSPNGYLVLGAAETVVGVTDAFMPVPDCPAVFTRRR